MLRLSMIGLFLATCGVAGCATSQPDAPTRLARAMVAATPTLAANKQRSDNLRRRAAGAERDPLYDGYDNGAFFPLRGWTEVTQTSTLQYWRRGDVRHEKRMREELEAEEAAIKAAVAARDAAAPN